MKKYFAKYIPVEGEIKEGDWYKSKFRTEHKFFHYEQWKSDREFYFGNDPKEDVLFKVKLFLCSRDITPEDYLIEGRVHVYHDGSEEPFKIIGEISPEATWVKEGDEFEENEIKRIAKGISNPVDSKYHIYQIKGPCGHYH